MRAVLTVSGMLLAFLSAVGLATLGLHWAIATVMVVLVHGLLFDLAKRADAGRT